jgi:polysaccharide deacetylase family protein (PEP-CTERM system associated)
LWKYGRANALTVDLEDWYQGTRVDVEQWPRFEDRIESSTMRLLELFDAADARATFFVLGYVAEQHPDLVRAIDACGHEIATHGYQHKLFYECTPDELRADIARSIEILEAITARPVIGHRAPFFSVTEASLWALEILAELGLRYDSSIFPIRHWRCGIPDATRSPHPIETAHGTLIEFPASTGRVLGVNLPFGGGAYLRTWPYPLTRMGIRSLNERGWPAVVYIHPWELDPARPRIHTDRSIAIAQRLNRASAGPRLAALLREFEFGPMRDLLDHPSLRDSAAATEARPARSGRFVRGRAESERAAERVVAREV